jgi:ASC-1-like (ASCH) protein
MGYRRIISHGRLFNFNSQNENMEKEFVQHRDIRPFLDIKSGRKKMEIRLNDEKRQKIKLGMRLKVVSRENEEDFFFTRVIGLSRFENFGDLYKVFGDKIRDYEKEILERVYSSGRVQKYGVLVIHFEMLD